MSDDRRYQRLRMQLVDELRRKGIHDQRVLAAIAAVPRHLFVEPALRSRAYEDEALPIGLRQTISQPFRSGQSEPGTATGRSDDLTASSSCYHPRRRAGRAGFGSRRAVPAFPRERGRFRCLNNEGAGGSGRMA
ncbi:MAG: hypothetical protein DIU65_13835, partial [Proteobacteria bacterium]